MAEEKPTKKREKPEGSGRPCKLQDPGTFEILATALGDGMTQAEAAGLGNVSARSLGTYLSKGEKLLRDWHEANDPAEKNPDEDEETEELESILSPRNPNPSPSEVEDIYLRFLLEVKKRRGNLQQTALRGIYAAGEKDWKAYAWLCERLWPERFARRVYKPEDAESGKRVLVEFVRPAPDPAAKSDSLGESALATIEAEEKGNGNGGKADGKV